jgi:excisionase family DNA binding protein
MMVEGYVTVKEIAEKWGLKARTVQIMCANGKIEGAVKFGRDWAIPADAEKPADKRIVSGIYIKNKK